MHILQVLVLVKCFFPESSISLSLSDEQAKVMKRLESLQIDADIIELSVRRGRMTPVQAIATRSLRAIRIIPGETLCNYKKYVDIFRQADNLEVSIVDLILEAKFRHENQDYYLYDPEDLCMVVGDDLVVDVYHFDCSQSGICICGVYFGYVDPNILQPENSNSNNMRKYSAVNGLDRKLKDEDGDCQSGPMGHCSLANSTAATKLECTAGLECTLDDSFDPYLYNKRTGEVYGLCLEVPSTVSPEDSMFAYEKINSASLLTLAPTGVTVFVLLLNLIFFVLS